MDIILNCDVCEENFDTINQRQVVGSCGHTFCEECAMQLKDSNCPKCRNRTDFIDAPQKFGLLRQAEAYRADELKTESRENVEEKCKSAPTNSNGEIIIEMEEIPQKQVTKPLMKFPIEPSKPEVSKTTTASFVGIPVNSQGTYFPPPSSIPFPPVEEEGKYYSPRSERVRHPIDRVGDCFVAILRLLWKIPQLIITCILYLIGILMGLAYLLTCCCCQFYDRWNYFSLN